MYNLSNSYVEVPMNNGESQEQTDVESQCNLSLNRDECKQNTDSKHAPIISKYVDMV
jgi:hypothetical protein